MNETKNKSAGYVVLLICQIVLIFLAFMYAYYGEYAHNKPSNIWSNIWSNGYLGVFLMVSNIITLIVSIMGMRKYKYQCAQRLLSRLLLASFFVNIISFMYAIGMHF